MVLVGPLIVTSSITMAPSEIVPFGAPGILATNTLAIRSFCLHLGPVNAIPVGAEAE